MPPNVAQDEEINQAEYEKQELWLQDFAGENSKYVKILRTEYNQLRDQRKGEAVYFALTKDHAWLSISEEQYNDYVKRTPELVKKLFTAPQPNALVEALEATCQHAWDEDSDVAYCRLCGIRARGEPS